MNIILGIYFILGSNNWISYQPNWFAPGRCGSGFESVTSEHMLRIMFVGTSSEIAPAGIDSSNGMVPWGNYPLPEPGLVQFYVAVWLYNATMSWRLPFHDDTIILWLFICRKYYSVLRASHVIIDQLTVYYRQIHIDCSIHPCGNTLLAKSI